MSIRMVMETYTGHVHTYLSLYHTIVKVGYYPYSYMYQVNVKFFIKTGIGLDNIMSLIIICTIYYKILWYKSLI